MSGVKGLTNIVYESFSKEWTVISLQEKNIIGMRNDTLPTGFNTWYLEYNCETATAVQKLPVKLKLNNVSLISMYCDPQNV